MKVTDEGLFLYSQSFGEKSKIIYILAKDNGLIKGLSRNTKNKKNNLINFDNVKFVWSSRNKDALGYLNIEQKEPNPQTKYLFSIIKASASELCIKFLPPWEKNLEIYKSILKLSLIQDHDDFNLIGEYIKWEINFLKNIGYELNINFCSVSGDGNEAYYISPKTGNAVSYSVGKKYSSKIFKIPLCMKDNFKKNFYEDYIDALHITGFFLSKILDYQKKKFIFRNQIIDYLNKL